MRAEILAKALGMMFLVIAVVGHADAVLTNPKIEWTIEPEGHEVTAIPPTGQDKSIGIDITSDNPVNIYILDQNQYYYYASSEVLSDYEKKYEGKTSLELDYKYPDQTIRYLVIINPSSSHSAEVTVEYDVLEEVIEENEPSSCCVGSMALLLVPLVLLVGTLVRLRR